MKRFELKNNKLYIQFRVENIDFNRTLSVVKSLENRWFDSLDKTWVAEASQKNIDILLNNNFNADPSVPKENEILVKNETPFKAVDRTKLPSKMRDYQVKGVEFLEAVDGNGIIGDVPRLGKSLQAIGYCMLHPEYKKILILCPANVKIVWQDEVKKWLNVKAKIIEGKTVSNLLMVDNRVFIINYDILYAWAEEIIKNKFDVLIVDELQYLGNNKRYDPATKKQVNVKRTYAYKQIAKKIPHKPHLSGTPIKSGPFQFFNVLNIIARQTFPNRWEFLQHHCDPKYNGFAWDYSGLTLSTAEELYNKIKPLMIRRTKEDVFTDLPVKQRIMVRFDKDDLNEKIEWIKDFLDSGEKLVCFCWNRAVCEKIHETFKKSSVLVYGGISALQKDKCKKLFQTDSRIKLFVGQVISANVGIDLSAADTVAFIQLPFNPGDLEQAEERVFLPGDGKKKITIYYLINKDTLEEQTALSLETKNTVVTKALDNKVAKEIFII